MPEQLVVATIEPASGFKQEAAVNTFAFKTTTNPDAATRLDILAAVAQFYTAIGGYLSSLYDRTASVNTLKMYDISGNLSATKLEDGGAPFGSPIDQGTFSLPAPISTTNLPAQVASVLTLRARNALTAPAEGSIAGNDGPVPIRPRARLSGRLYLGRLNRGAETGSTNTESRPIAGFRSAVLAAAEALQDDLVDGAYAWGVWSRARAEVVPIVRVEMDDAFDVLRSRRAPATARDGRTFSPAPALVLGS